METLSLLQARVFHVVRQNGPIGPKQIGLHLDFSYETASGQVTRPLKTLVARGLLEKIVVNQRVVKYKLASENVPVMHIIPDEPPRLNTLITLLENVNP